MSCARPCALKPAAKIAANLILDKYDKELQYMLGEMKKDQESRRVNEVPTQANWRPPMLQRALAGLALTGLEHYWSAFARLAASSRSGFFAGGDMA
jgi:hypothetical protein